ncbi:MAG TPA: hypothetical protein VF240_05980 [Pyrinomonadaceae bacterium]
MRAMNWPSTVAESKLPLLVPRVSTVIALWSVKKPPRSMRWQTLACVEEIISYLLSSVKSRNYQQRNDRKLSANNSLTIGRAPPRSLDVCEVELSALSGELLKLVSADCFESYVLQAVINKPVSVTLSSLCDANGRRVIEKRSHRPAQPKQIARNICAIDSLR